MPMANTRRDFLTSTWPPPQPPHRSISRPPIALIAPTPLAASRSLIPASLHQTFLHSQCPTMGGLESLAFRRHLKVHLLRNRVTISNGGSHCTRSPAVMALVASMASGFRRVWTKWVRQMPNPRSIHDNDGLQSFPKPSPLGEGSLLLHSQLTPLPLCHVIMCAINTIRLNIASRQLKVPAEPGPLLPKSVPGDSGADPWVAGVSLG
jgi:hypothetical protein